MEVMSRNPVKVGTETTVEEGAIIMTQKGISSLLVEEGNEIVGIVTERDLVTKVVSKNLQGRNIRLKEIMSHPLVYVEEDSPLEVAAEIMWKRKIRRLPVQSKGRVVGILTENDIVRISPGLIEITRGILPGRNEGIINGIHGMCDECGEYSENLVYRAGKYYCERCFSSIEPL
jgi:CBS domain-containing protein